MKPTLFLNGIYTSDLNNNKDDLTMSKNIIWSTDNCGFCTKAKQLLTNAGITFEERLVDGVRWTRNDLLGHAPNAKTFPQIFLGADYVGGCDDLENRLFLTEDGFNDL